MFRCLNTKMLLVKMLKCLNVKMTEKGVSVYLALMIMIIVLAIGLGISTIIVSQMKMIRGMGDSVVAIFAADTGIERALYALYKEGASLPFTYSGSVGDSSYSVEGWLAGSVDCPTPPNDYYCLKSIGTYKGTKRAIEGSR